MSIDQKLLEVEKEIRRVRMTPKEIEIKCHIDQIKEQTEEIENEIKQIKAKPEYLGKLGHEMVSRLTKQLQLQRDKYKLCKRACFDLIEVFSELNGVDEETFKLQCGLEEADFADEDI